MGGGCIQILLIIEPESQCAISSTSSAEGSCLSRRKYALLPSQTENHAIREILAENGIEVFKSAHVNSSWPGKMEMVEVFVGRGPKGHRKRLCIHLDYMNNFIEHLFIKSSKFSFTYQSSTAAHFVLDEEENLQVIEKVLAAGVEITARHSNGGTLLHFAANSSHFYEKLMKLALKYGAKINAKRDDGMAPLHIAVENNCLGSVRLLLENGALINPRMKDGSTPLHVAAREKRFEIASLLLDSGANANAQMNSRSTPCHEAAKAGSLEIVRLLLERGANVDIKMKNLSTPLHKGVEAGSIEIAEQLVQSGADINAKMKDCTTPLHIAARLYGGDSILVYLIKNGADINALDNTGATPVHYCVRGDPTVMQLLVAHGADINVETNSRQTVLLKAVFRGMFETCDYLLSLNPNLSVKGNRTAFKVALGRVKPKYQEMINRMVQQGFSLDANDANDPDFLFGAIFTQHPEIVEQLLILGANVNQRGKFRRHTVTPLHLAIQCNEENIVRLLLDHGANVGAKCDLNNCESTPMSYAVRFASLDIIKLLVARNVKVREEPFLLHSAVKNADSEIIQFLLEEGADLNVKTEMGQTPISIAFNTGNLKAFEVLIRFGARVSLMDISGKVIRDPTCMEALLDYCFMKPIFETYTALERFRATAENLVAHYNSLAVFKRHLIKMQMANKFACGRDSVPSHLYELLDLNDFKKQCEFEIEALALEKVGHSDVTFYDVLVKNQAQIAGFARNQYFVETFEMCDVKNKFPIYGSVLESKFRSGSLRRNLLKRGIKVLSIFSRLFFDLPDDLKEIVVDYLNNQDLFILLKGLPEE